MNSAWTVEFVRVFFIFSLAILFGFVFDAWLLAMLLAGLSYIIWTLIQLRTFEQWIRLGAKTKLAPEFSGIWQLIVQHNNRTQKKNKQQKQRLSTLARKFEATISALPDATIVLNSEKEIEWTNNASMELFGIDKRRDLGLRFDNLVRNHELHQLLDQSELPASIEIESPVDRLKTLMISCVNFGDEQKLVTARDVTQRVAVQKLRKAFIANASHELRTPLTVISGYLELLATEPDISIPLKNQINNAGQQAIRMQKILDDMLILSGLEARGFSENSGEKVDMPILLQAMVNDFQKTNAKDDYSFEVKIETNLCLKAIENELYSLCQNLLSNAVKYSPEGSRIVVNWKTNSKGEICLQVEDNGEGIAAEHISRLTERFYRVNVNRSRQVGGTGLGLSIVKHILENHGGYLDIKSELGLGSTFTACFPRERICECNPR